MQQEEVDELLNTQKRQESLLVGSCFFKMGFMFLLILFPLPQTTNTTRIYNMTLNHTKKKLLESEIIKKQAFLAAKRVIQECHFQCEKKKTIKKQII
jgi:hypothetical protein